MRMAYSFLALIILLALLIAGCSETVVPEASPSSSPSIEPGATTTPVPSQVPTPKPASPLATNTVPGTIANVTPTATGTLASQKGVIVTYPIGGENWLVGDNVTITWTSTGVPKDAAVDIEIEPGGLIGSTKNTGSFQWLVSRGSVGSQRRVGIIIKTHLIARYSEGYFTISLPEGWKPEEPPSLTNSKPASFGTVEDAAIYISVIQQLATRRDTGKLPPVLYIFRNTGDYSPGRIAPGSNAPLISQNVQNEITNILKSLQTETVWIDKLEDAIEPGIGRAVKGGGAAITLGNIYPWKNGSVCVAGAVHFANMGASGDTYILTKTEGVWKVTGRVGPSWVS